MKKTFLLFMLFLLIPLVQAAWFSPDTPPSVVYNNNTNLTANIIISNGAEFYGDVNMHNYSLYNAFFVNSTFVDMVTLNVTDDGYFAGDVDIDGDVDIAGDVDIGGDLDIVGNITIDGVGSADVWIESGNNLHSCLYLMEGATLGFSICNDGSGDNNLVFSAINGAGDVTPVFNFDRDTMEIDLLDDTTVTGNLDVTENITVTGTTSSTSFGELMPAASLTYDIGSGPLRWGDLYVSDISCDDISAYDITVTGTYYGDGANITNLNVNGSVTFINSSPVMDENLTIRGRGYNTIITGTTIYSDTYFNPLLQLGGGSSATGNNAVAVGMGATASSHYCVALGGSATCNGASGIAIGDGSTGGYRAIALGYQSVASGDYSTASGWVAQATGEGATSIGWQTGASGKYSLAMGSYSKARGNYATAIGNFCDANGVYSYAFGRNVTVNGTHSYGFGEDGFSSSNNTFSLHNLDVMIDGDLNVTGNFTGNQIYGGIWYHNHTGTELNFAVDGQFYSLWFTNASHLNGFTTNNLGFGLNSSLQAEVSGLYQAIYMVSGDGQNNHQYYASVFINKINQDNCESHKKMSAGGDIVTMTGSCFVDLNTEDNVSVRIADIGGTGTGNYYSSNFNLVRIGD